MRTSGRPPGAPNRRAGPRGRAKVEARRGLPISTSAQAPSTEITGPATSGTYGWPRRWASTRIQWLEPLRACAGRRRAPLAERRPESVAGTGHAHESALRRATAETLDDPERDRQRQRVARGRGDTGADGCERGLPRGRSTTSPAAALHGVDQDDRSVRGHQVVRHQLADMVGLGHAQGARCRQTRRALRATASSPRIGSPHSRRVTSTHRLSAPPRAGRGSGSRS